MLTRAGKPDPILRCHLGPEGEHTVHKAELTGILLAIHLIKTEKATSVPIAIGADNQAALRAFDSDLRGPAHSIAREALDQANILRNKKGHKKHPLTLR